MELISIIFSKLQKYNLGLTTLGHLEAIDKLCCRFSVKSRLYEMLRKELNVKLNIILLLASINLFAPLANANPIYLNCWRAYPDGVNLKLNSNFFGKKTLQIIDKDGKITNANIITNNELYIYYKDTYAYHEQDEQCKSKGVNSCNSLSKKLDLKIIQGDNNTKILALTEWTDTRCCHRGTIYERDSFWNRSGCFIVDLVK